MAGWRVRRSKMFGPFRITATKSGLGISAGGPFGRMSVNTRGEVRKTVRVPGVGIYKTEKVAQLGEPHPPHVGLPPVDPPHVDHPRPVAEVEHSHPAAMAAPAPPAAWYPDPRDERSWRWWDGTDWTAHTAPR